LQSVAALGAVECLLKIVSGTHGADATRRWCFCQTGPQVDAWEFCGTVELGR
jgi:hypothetical protein